MLERILDLIPPQTSSEAIPPVTRDPIVADDSGPRFRVAMVAACPFPWPRGTPARALGLATAMARAGHEVHVVAYGVGSPIGDLPFRIHRIARVPGYRRTAAGPDPVKLGLLDPLLAHRLLQVVRRHNIEVVHAHHYEGLLAALPARRRTGVPVVYDAHTTLAEELPYYSLLMPRTFVHRMGRWLDRRLPALADHTVATTHRLAASRRRAPPRAGERHRQRHRGRDCRGRLLG